MLKNLLFNIKIVAWGFLGLRSKKNFDKDIKNVNFLSLILTAFIGLLLFIGSLILFIKFIVLS